MHIRFIVSAYFLIFYCILPIPKQAFLGESGQEKEVIFFRTNLPFSWKSILVCHGLDMSDMENSLMISELVKEKLSITELFTNFDKKSFWLDNDYWIVLFLKFQLLDNYWVEPW